MSLLTTPRPDEQVMSGGLLARVWYRWVAHVGAILAGKRPLQLAAYTVAALPAAAEWKRCVVVVTDDVGGEVAAVSDGTSWRRTTDRAVVTS